MEKDSTVKNDQKVVAIKRIDVGLTF